MQPRLVRLAILDTYAVAWSREAFARDLLQNFFDAAPDFRDVTLDIDADAGTVEIRGPTTFDVDLLAYVGATTKTSGKTAGGFGEGFKVCALIGARDLGLTMRAGTGADEIEVALEPVPLGRELCYRMTRRDPPFPGAFVRLEGCDAETIAAFRAAPAMFRHPGNPKLKELVVEDAAAGVAVYRGPDRRWGELYYRRQLRGQVRFYGSGEDSSITLAHDAPIEALEGDRDRRDLPPRPLAKAIGMKLSPDALGTVIHHLQAYWRYGNEVLSGFLDAAIERRLSFEFPRGWLARAPRSHGLDALAERGGIKLALADFGAIGMKRVTDHFTDLETRPASPEEEAKLLTVADLYQQLAGTPSRVKRFEVFDSDRAAVMGQHLGDRVLVDAKLVRKGFDAVASTVLHELSHELGGEETEPFLKRLTKLLGAAMRAPEAVQAARARYAEARPAEAKPEEAPAAPYDPAPDRWKAVDADGVACTLVVPPAFPPTADILAALFAAGEAAGLKVWLFLEEVTGPLGAMRWLAPGVPTLWIGEEDPEPRGAGEEPGYRLRTYGAAGDRLYPEPEAMKAALLRGKEAKLTGRRGFLARERIQDRGSALVEARTGRKRPPKPAPADRARERRLDALRKHLDNYAGWGGVGLGEMWTRGIELAGRRRIEEHGDDKRLPMAIWTEIRLWLDRLVTISRKLRREDKGFDDAESFELDAMKAAQGAAIFAAAEDNDEEAGKARAERAFRAMRAATERVLDLDVALEVKPELLERALEVAGMTAFEPSTRFDVGAFEAEFERAVALARQMQRDADEEGRSLPGFTVKMALQGGPRQLSPEYVAKQRAKAVATHAIRAAYEEALAATGSKAAAAARAIEAAAQVLPEEVGDEQ